MLDLKGPDRVRGLNQFSVNDICRVLGGNVEATLFHFLTQVDPAELSYALPF
jgi:hypothetical protein